MGYVRPKKIVCCGGKRTKLPDLARHDQNKEEACGKAMGIPWGIPCGVFE
jgi:hypothetical protein